MKAWIIAVNEWKQLLREREAYFWIFIGPLIFITFFGFIFKPSPPQPLRVAILNRDATGEVATAMAAALQADGVEVETVSELPGNRRTVEIPAGAAGALRLGDPIDLVLRTGDEPSESERTLQFKIQKALTKTFLDGLPDAGAPTGGGTGRSEALYLVREEIDVKTRDMTTGFQRSVPAYMVMFVFMNLLIGGSTIAEDRASGRLRRIALAPVKTRDILLGKLLSRFTIGWIQIVYLLVIGTLVFQIEWGQRNWFFLLFMSLFALTSATLGILIGTVIRDPDKAIAAAIWSAVILSPLGGLWWPLEVVGPTMRKIALFIPTGWAMEGVNSMLAFGAGPEELYPFLLAFAGLFLLAFLLAARRLRP